MFKCTLWSDGERGQWHVHSDLYRIEKTYSLRIFQGCSQPAAPAVYKNIVLHDMKTNASKILCCVTAKTSWLHNLVLSIRKKTPELLYLLFTFDCNINAAEYKLYIEHDQVKVSQVLCSAKLALGSPNQCHLYHVTSKNLEILFYKEQTDK